MLPFTDPGQGGCPLIAWVLTKCPCPNFGYPHDAIFQEFAQVENRLQHKYKGTGLGLPLSKRLAELLGGGITLASEIGAGSTFSLTVPRLYQAPAGQQDAMIAERLEPNRMPMCILASLNALSLSRRYRRHRQFWPKPWAWSN